MASATSLASVLNEYGVEQFLPLTKLHVDESYQRTYNERRARAMSGPKFDPDLAGRLIVNVRPDGRHFIVDGQHRCAAMRMSDRSFAPCVVYSGWSVEKEAQIFKRMNESVKRPTSFERHKAALRAGDPTAVGIQSIVNEMGGEFAEHHPKGGTPRRIACVDVMYRLYGSTSSNGSRQYRTSGPEFLRQTLRIIMQAWGDKEYTDNVIMPFNVDVVMGLATFLSRANADPNFEESHLITVLSITPPQKIVFDARVHVGHKASLGIAVEIKKAYNKTKRGKKLDDWVIEELPN